MTNSTLDLTSETTARGARAILQSHGIEGEAADALVRETASCRHAHRVREARRIALEAVSHLPSCDRVIAAAAILLSDSLGIGGRDGCEGAATSRVPALHACGKGRKQARDGGAWSSAIAESARELLREDSGDHARATWIAVTTEGDRWRLYLAVANVHGETDSVDVTDLIPRPWRRTIAREGLRRAALNTSWHHAHPAGFSDDLAAWANLVNAIDDEIAAERRAEEDARRAKEHAAREAQSALPRVLDAMGYVPATFEHARAAGLCADGIGRWLGENNPDRVETDPEPYVEPRAYKLTRAHIESSPDVRRVAEIAAAAWVQQHPETLAAAPASDEPRAIPSL